MNPVLPGLPTSVGPFVIAEAGVNHNGDAETALRLVDAAAEAGADAVKFQTFVPELVAAAAAPKAPYQKRDGESVSQLDMITRLALSHEAFQRISTHCERRGVLFLSTPFDRPSADFLVHLGVPAIKAPSGELTNLPFLQYLARLGKPLIISTGMADLGEVERGVAAVERGGCSDYALLHCTSSYPAEVDDVNLSAMRTLADIFERPVGYSDHTIGVDIAIAAAALGARIVEKHFTLDRNAPGPDHQASIEPDDLKRMIDSVRRVARAIGDGAKRPRAAEKPIARIARRSLATARSLAAGAIIGEHDVIELRPGGGIPPDRLRDILGRRLRQESPPYQLIEWSMLE